MEKVEKEFISERQASLLLGVSAVCVFTWRENGTLPKDLYIEKQYPTIKRVFYKKAELLEWQKGFNTEQIIASSTMDKEDDFTCTLQSTTCSELSVDIEKDAASILKRVKERLDFKNDSELASYLNVGNGTISNWKSRNKIPYDEIFEICEKNNFSLDYIFYGHFKQDEGVVTC